MNCNSCGKEIEANLKFCPHCGQAVVPQSTEILGNQPIAVNPLPVTNPQSPNNFSTNINPEQDAFIHSAAWGPTLTWIYLLGNRAWLAAVVALILACIPVIGFISFLVLIFKGRSWAWKMGDWTNFEEFKQRQKGWDLAGKIFTIIFLMILPVLGIIVAALLFVIKPSEGIKEIYFSPVRSTISMVAPAVEACYIKEATDTYDLCDSIQELVSGKYLNWVPVEITPILFIPSNDGRDIIIGSYLEAELAKSKGECKSTDVPYYAYSSIDGVSKVRCSIPQPPNETASQDSADEIKEIQTPDQQADSRKETQDIINKVSKITSLPDADLDKNEPTLATVQYKDALAKQPFFINSENGDKVLIYNKAKKAILYRPSTNVIINVSLIN